MNGRQLADAALRCSAASASWRPFIEPGMIMPDRRCDRGRRTARRVRVMVERTARRFAETRARHCHLFGYLANPGFGGAGDAATSNTPRSDWFHAFAPTTD